ncbi:MAG: prepilin-type N-terminal cleavage/methylation domain-containing protein [Dethiobacter sp.]|nr:prepilin-type N-terminal cleavage/methylation domain-containing protein [Dethiobacter sp.]
MPDGKLWRAKVRLWVFRFPVWSRYGNGFTLAELLVVVAIIGVVALIVLPVHRQLTGWPLQGAALELSARVREMRHAAIATGQRTELGFFLFDGLYRVSCPERVTLVRLPAGVSFAAINFPSDGVRHTLSFRFTGAPNQGGHVALRDRRGNRLFVIVTPVTGRVRVAEQPPS